MGRPLRINNPGTWFHVLNRGAARQDIFLDDRDRLEFERLLGVAADRFGIRVHAFCLMGNHYHLLLECPDGQLSQAMHLLGSVFVRHANARQGRDGPMFRDRFYAKPVASDTYLRRLVRYIHRNPLAFLPVEQLGSYRWSSLRVYLGRRRVPRWMSTETLLSMFDDVSSFERFNLGRTAANPERLGPAGWRAAIEVVLEEQLSDTTRQGAAKTVAVLLLDHLEGVCRDDVAELVAFPTPDAERVGRNRARKRAQVCPDLRRVVEGVIDLAA